MKKKKNTNDHYETQFQIFFRHFLRHKLAVAGGVTIFIFVILVMSAGFLSFLDPLRLDTSVRFTSAFELGKFPLGTDELGRDVLSRLLYGGRISLVVGLAAMLATIVTGVTIGTVSGYYGGIIDLLLMRFTDIMLSFPQVFLLLLLAAFVTPTVLSIALIIGLTSWMEIARIIRSQILSLKEMDYIQAAEALGSSGRRIMFRELLPNCMGSIVVAGTLTIAKAILNETYISYLGYGIQAPLASWGNMLTNAQSYFDMAPALAIFPGTMITLTVISFNFLGDGLRDALDPKLQL